MDPLFNVLLLPVDALVVAAVARSKRAATGWFAVGAGLLAAYVVATVLEQGAFHLFRLYAYALFAHTPLVLAGIAWVLRRRSRWTSGLALAAASLVCIVALQAFVFEPRRLEVSTVRVSSTKVARPIRVAVVADLQTDRIGAHERRALLAALDAEPDLILMPGDYLHENSAARRELASEFAALLEELDFGAPLGAYAVRGNVEHNDWPGLFSGSGVTALTRTTTLALGEVELTGLGLRDSFDTTLRVAGSERFHIAFGHGPDFALGDVGADLLVAGHTHGGQVRLPLFGPLLTLSRVPRAWAAGVTALPGGRTLVVSRGIGMERGSAPRLRFLCRPEVVIIDVVPAG